MSTATILWVGVFVFSMLVVGIVLTIREFQTNVYSQKKRADRSRISTHTEDEGKRVGAAHPQLELTLHRLDCT